MKYLYLSVIALLALFSCDPLEVIIGDELSNEGEVQPSNGLIIYQSPIDKNIYTNNTKGTAELLVEELTDDVIEISLSYDLTQYAYLDAQNNLHIMDISGTEIDFVDESAAIIGVEWTSTPGNLAYFLANGQLKAWGSNFSIPIFSHPAGANILDFSISKENDFAFIYYGSNNFFNDIIVQIYEADGTESITIFPFYMVERVKFSNDGNGKISTYSEIGPFDNKGAVYGLREDNSYFILKEFNRDWYDESIYSDSGEYVQVTVFSNTADFKSNIYYIDNGVEINIITPYENHDGNIKFDWKK